ncbi:MAG: rhomboid family intramembrane serine protease [Acidobacteriota bacterium]
MGTYYELALISVLVAGGYWGWYFARIDSLRTYGLMQLAAAALSGLGLLGRKYDDAALGIAGAIGVGTGVCLLVLGPLARGLARRAAAAERFALAQRLLDVADVLAPGSGVSDEKALLGAMRELREGNIERTVDALVAAKDRAPADARLAIDERIAMLYLSAYRWDEAIAHAEAHLFDALPPPEPRSPQVPLRRVLGVAPPVWVELLGAYGYLGDLDRAASMLARLEEACAGRDDAAIWLHRGRMMFLALAGRVDAVQSLVEPRRSRHMSAGARTYWIAVAHERRGETVAAEAAYARARSLSRGRPRALIDQALKRLESAKPVELGPELSDVIARVEAAAPPKVAPRTTRGPVATRALLATIVAAALAIELWIGDSSDVGVLVRAGAMVRGLIDAGEWWRLVSCIFVHVGGVHLLVNAVGLWFLGRLTEDLFGGWRTAAVFAAAALVGATASFLASPAGISAGASGGIFGLLGAVFLEMTWHRKRHRAAWRAGVWGSLAVVAIAQIAVDVVEPITDQWAHGGGLAAGALCGILLSPYARWQRVGLWAARAIAVAFAALCVVATVMVARTSLADSLEHDWHAVVDTAAVREVAEPPAAAVEHAKQELAKEILKEDPDAKIADASERVVALPAGWQGTEQVVTEVDPLDNTQVDRAVIAARPTANGAIVVVLRVPQTIARAAPGFFTQLLARQ